MTKKPARKYTDAELAKFDQFAMFRLIVEGMIKPRDFSAWCDQEVRKEVDECATHYDELILEVRKDAYDEGWNEGVAESRAPEN